MQIHSFPIGDIHISPTRQRREFKPESIIELATSIAKNGLLHPVVVRQDGDKVTLVAGERRLKALHTLWNMGEKVRISETVFRTGIVPCLLLAEMDAVDAFEAELEENVRREDLTWQEKAQATSQLFELRKLQAEKAHTDLPTVLSLAQEIHGEPNKGSGELGSAHERVRRELIVSKHLDNPEVAKAKSTDEAFKILRRQEEAKKMVTLGESVGKTFSAKLHTLIKGDCLEYLETIPEGTFDCILSDPPYGMDAQDFGDSGGMTPGAHGYDDSLANFSRLMATFLPLSFQISKPMAHLYLFCDIDNFSSLRDGVAVAGWKPFRTPFIWHNPGGMRAPWPLNGPQRKWQMCLYAVKGNRPVINLRSDVLEYRSDENLGHAAQKPVGLFSDLLRRTCRPGDLVLDPFCGSGPIFPAANELKVVATGVERDEVSYGIAVKRLGSLK